MDKKYKVLTKSRGLTIPKDMAAHLDFHAGTAVDLTATGDGKLIISKHVNVCRFCGDSEVVKEFSGIYCCPLCATKLYQEVTSYE